MLTVRRLEKTDVDLEIFKTLRLEALKTHPEAYASGYDDWVTLDQSGWYARMDDVFIQVAFNQNDPIGMMAVHVSPRSRFAHRGTMVMVYLRDTARGSGAAKAMLDACARCAKDAGLTQLELSVSAANARAQGFYLREGFVQFGRLPNGYCHDNVLTDDIMMWRPIP